MKKMKLSLALVSLVTMGMSTNLSAQVSGDNAFMIGDHVEVGISQYGYEGAELDSTIATHYRGGAGRLGFLSNPRADGWIQYNGDFYMPGSPENGFGIGYTEGGTDHDLANVASEPADIPGEIISYYETVDSVIVVWQGMPTYDSLQVTLKHTLQKDQHFYRTFVQLDNIGSDTYTDVYYFRTLDPDNNQDILWGFATQNTIISQSEMADDSVRVSATSTDAWISIMLFEAYGPEWKAYTGGFWNRDASQMWEGSGSLEGTEGYTIFSDQSMGISLKIPSLPPGTAKIESEVYSFTTSFKDNIDYTVEIDTDGLNEIGEIDFKLYPNPNQGDVIDLQIDGEFTYSIVDLKGSIALSGQGNGFTQINLNTLDKGIYILNIAQENARATEKLIIE
jgi:hypothetical protein